MKKFKLIKKLPFENSPEIGYISKPTMQKDYAHYWNHNWFQPKGYPEYWEEVVEKNYKIIILKQHDGRLSNMTGHGEEYITALLNTHGVTIYSVERLSDGKVFTIGDKVQDSLTDELTNYAIQEITYFYPGEKIICQAKSGTTMPLNTIRHTSFLFKTEDGVNISEGDDYWVYDYGALKNTNSEIHKVNRASQTHTGNGVDRKYFSTKEKAEEYVLLNKPCLSINDVRNCINQTEIDIDNEHELNYQLNELVKQKL